MEQTKIAEPLITIREAAAYLRCSPAFLWKMRKEGKLQALSAGKKVLFTQSAIENFLKPETRSKHAY